MIDLPALGNGDDLVQALTELGCSLPHPEPERRGEINGHFRRAALSAEGKESSLDTTSEEPELPAPPETKTGEKSRKGAEDSCDDMGCQHRATSSISIERES